jgi:hypothetical protein
MGMGKGSPFPMFSSYYYHLKLEYLLLGTKDEQDIGKP